MGTVVLPPIEPFYEYDNERFLVDYLNPFVTAELKWRLENIICEEEMLDLEYPFIPKCVGFLPSDLGMTPPTSVVARNKFSLEFLFLINHINEDGIHFFIAEWYYKKFMRSDIFAALKFENCIRFLNYVFDHMVLFMEQIEIFEEPYDVSLDAEWIGSKKSAAELFNVFIDEIFVPQ